VVGECRGEEDKGGKEIYQLISTLSFHACLIMIPTVDDVVMLV